MGETPGTREEGAAPAARADEHNASGAEPRASGRHEPPPRTLRWALLFGVVAATVELGLILLFAC